VKIEEEGVTLSYGRVLRANYVYFTRKLYVNSSDLPSVVCVVLVC